MQGKLPEAVKDLLEEKARIYNTPAFIEDDPIQIPHAFGERENIEISGFLAAMLAWGRRDIIIRNTMDLIGRMDKQPYQFLLNMNSADLEVFRDFKHRTFNGEDCIFFYALPPISLDRCRGLIPAFFGWLSSKQEYKRSNSEFPEEILPDCTPK